VVHRRYTPLGNRIIELGGQQSVLAQILQVSQQTISKKLRGLCAISVSDLEKLAKHFKVPMTAFFEAAGLDGAVLKDFHAMFRAKPLEVDRILDAFKLNPANLTHLAQVAASLIQAGLGGKQPKVKQ